MIRIITDSTSDISHEEAQRMGIDIVPLKVLFGDREYTDGVDLQKEQFYRLLEDSTSLPTTSQVNPDGFTPLFTRYTQAGDDVLVITLSAKLSGTCQSALIARDEVGKDHIHIVDTDSVTFGEALLVYEAVRLRDEGAGVVEIVAHLEGLKGRVRFYAMVNTLRYLKMGGRLSGSAALIGGVLGIKPIVTVTGGEVKSIAKARGQRAAFQWMLDKVVADPPDPGYTVSFGHTNSPASMEEFVQFMSGALGQIPHMVEEIGCVIGTHAGPGCVGLAYIAQSS